MLACADLDSIARAITSASSLTESSFLEIGRKLESSIDILGSLTGTFERLFHELESENVRRAAQDIRGAAAQVSELAQAHDGEKKAVGKLSDLTGGVEGGVSLIHKSVKGAGMLAISARIAAANLGENGGDFVSFANDIGETLKLAQTTLDRFRSELGETGGHVAAAKASQVEFDASHSEAIRSIPDRLTRSIDAIADGSRRAAAAAAAVQEKSRQVSLSIASAVMALQIGDKTRQRIEHAGFALAILREAAASGTAGEANEWSALDEGERTELIALGCRLQAAQLADAAADFGREVEQILAALNGLGAGAREILQLGNTTYGGGTRRGAFLLDLKDEVSQANGLLSGFGAARDNIGEVISAVSRSGASLFGHIGTVRSLEADIRIMGLNATLKCGRLGARGRALSVVAQELRLYAKEIANEATAVMTGLDGVVATAESLSNRSGRNGADDIAAVAAAMAGSVDRLGAAGESLTGALTALERDSGTVASLLDETVDRMAAHQQIGGAMAQAAADLARLVADAAPRRQLMSPAQQRMLEMVAAAYTMAQERSVHDKVVRDAFVDVTAGQLAGAAAGAAASANVDDLLF